MARSALVARRPRTSQLAPVLALAVLILSAVVPAGARADTFPGFTSGLYQFHWEAKRLSCGTAGLEGSNRLRSHALWLGSPREGYVRWRLGLQGRRGDGWETVAQKSVSTRNTRLEGSDTPLHAAAALTPPAALAGRLARNTVLIEWRRDAPDGDELAFAQRLVSTGCRPR
jgi:hypothetical protein